VYVLVALVRATSTRRLPMVILRASADQPSPMPSGVPWAFARAPQKPLDIQRGRAAYVDATCSILVTFI
jgi:hypothetical protein